MTRSPHELRFQIEQMKRKIEELERRSEDRISYLTEEKNFWNSIKSGNDEETINKQYKQLEASYLQYASNIELDNNKEISKYNFHIDELKNDISQEEAKNAKIVTENIDLGSKIDQLQGEYNTLINKYVFLRPKFEKLLSKVIQTKVQSHTSQIKNIDKITNSLSSLEEKLNREKLQIKDECDFYHENKKKIKQAEDIVKRLEDALLDISDLPEFSAPEPSDLINNPDLIIKFVDNVEQHVRTKAEEREKKLSKNNRSVAATMSESRKSPLSKDVAKVICEVGHKVVDLSNEYSSVC
ncbi:hypothetical protein TVAG_025130 [Trichomonas vaginalis G3]|uniref:Uncharacterized protein n=1 Tax=Trichomonas vaginalis (strain ATCC PRA-98 / G3) TaxID=412133 RepID=A2FCU6_TRIV3|nr:hypothetical protein TVAGG3_0203450 [Trichomonas vaginalis G3]EAX97277.1 hypothetical protein TVAG_025130 [Trichomonas vaginalis G3]KAI5550759.1 hypothetical protein TVAGG3_0203450 [Trichomonas vaginalis G3]|eukprot:XP_001310207.1 hypothetical protein [Trichomonas vaginalis G3]